MSAKRRINIKVIPNAKVSKVSEFRDGLKVKVNAPAENGKANHAVLSALAKYLQVATHQLEIVQGQLQANKVIEIDE